MSPPQGWQNPITVLPGQTQRGADASGLLPSRMDLIKVRLEFQRSLLQSGQARFSPIQVTRDGVIFDGHHAVRAAAEQGAVVDVLVIDQNVPPCWTIDTRFTGEVTQMTCPTEVAAIILEIIQTGVLRIRCAGWSGNADQCAVEADHIHNLPDLLRNYAPDRLRYYWEVERPSFIGHTPRSEVSSFEPLWNKLRSHVPSSADHSLAS